MAQLITRIRTESGDLQIDYDALANLPQSDKTLSKDGGFADAKATSEAIKNATVGIDGTLENQGQAADAKAVGTKFNTIENAITEINSAVSTAQGTADNALSKTGGDMSGNINMGEKNITNLAAPTNDNDAVNKKYVDEKYFSETVTLTASKWVGSVAPYTQVVSLDGILDTDNPHYCVVYSGITENKLAQKEAFALIDELVTSNGSLTFTCLEEKPTVDLDIQLEVNR